MAATYSELPNKLVNAANGIGYAYRDAGDGAVPLVLLQHFRGNLDNWDPALIDALALDRRVGGKEEAGRVLAAKSGTIFAHLAERQRRRLMGAEARPLSHGGIRLVALAAGVRKARVPLGVDELDSGAEPLGRARRPGGRRKRAADLDPGCAQRCWALVEPEERG